MSFSVFISYSTRDLAHASALQASIASAGAQPYLAEYSLVPGQPLSQEILAAIRGCDLFLLLWSDHARESEWVPQEIGVARGGDKPILPVVLHPDIGLPGFIRDLKYLEVHKDPTAALQWLVQEVNTRVRKKESDRLVALGVLGAVVVLVASLSE